MRRSRTFIFTIIAVQSLSVSHAESRYDQYTAQLRNNVVSVHTLGATYFGGPGNEEFIGGGIRPDGNVMAVGNADSTDLGAQNVRVWGADETVPPGTDVNDKVGRPDVKKLLDPGRIQALGFVARFAPDLQRILGVQRLGRGVGSFVGALVGPDGNLYVNGRCRSDRLRRAWAAARYNEQASEGAVAAPDNYPDAFVAKLNADGPAWVVLFRNSAARDLPLMADNRGLVLDRGHLMRLTFDGRTLINLNIGGAKPDDGHGPGLSVSSLDGTVLRGGDRNTRTGNEPYRDPWLEVYAPDGKLKETLWNWDPKVVGGPDRLVADSGAQLNGFTPDGDIAVAGWSDGGNSVFSRQPKRLDAPNEALKNGFVDSLWGMKIGRAIWLMILDPKDYTVKRATIWDSFLPAYPGGKGNRPNFASAVSMAFASDGSPAVVGSSATALIETPDAWFHRPADKAYGGMYLTIFTPDLSSVRFSSYMPGFVSARVVAQGDRFLVLGSTAANDGEDGNAPPLVRPVRKSFGGGAFDAHLALLRVLPMR